jgi:hypothetical protein
MASSEAPLPRRPHLVVLREEAAELDAQLQRVVVELRADRVPLRRVLAVAPPAVARVQLIARVVELCTATALPLSPLTARLCGLPAEAPSYAAFLETVLTQAHRGTGRVGGPAVASASTSASAAAPPPLPPPLPPLPAAAADEDPSDRRDSASPPRERAAAGPPPPLLPPNVMLLGRVHQPGSPLLVTPAPDAAGASASASASDNAMVAELQRVVAARMAERQRGSSPQGSGSGSVSGIPAKLAAAAPPPGLALPGGARHARVAEVRA